MYPVTQEDLLQQIITSFWLYVERTPDGLTRKSDCELEIKLIVFLCTQMCACVCAVSGAVAAVTDAAFFSCLENVAQQWPGREQKGRNISNGMLATDNTSEW